MKVHWNVKTANRLFLVTLGIVLSYAAICYYVHANSKNEVVAEASLVSEARQLRKFQRDPELDVSEIARKYVKLGTSRQSVLRYLARSGFKVSPAPQWKNLNEVWMASLEPLVDVPFSPEIFYDELRLPIEFDNDEVVSSAARIIYRAL
jgi:hypothetical protein